MAASNLLRFDPEEHRYFLGKNELPGVTRVLKSAGLVDDTWFTEYSRIRGKHIHDAIQLHNERDLDEKTLDPRIRPYLDAYRDFLKESHLRVYLSERQVHSKLYGYAGTFDLYGLMGRRRALIDVKTGAMPRWVGLQLAGYRQAAIECGLQPVVRYSLQLRPDGEFRLREEKGRLDLAHFLTALAKHKEITRE